MSNSNKEKRLAFETLLDQGRLQIWVDRLTEWVDVPGSIVGFGPEDRIVALNYSKRFHMPQFKVTDTGVTATLSFNNRPHMTIVPWEAVLAVFQDGKLLESWEEQGWKVIEAPGKGYVFYNMRQPDYTPPWPTPADSIAQLDHALETDPEMSKWFTGTVAEG